LTSIPTFEGLRVSRSTAATRDRIQYRIWGMKRKVFAEIMFGAMLFQKSCLTFSSLPRLYPAGNRIVSRCAATPAQQLLHGRSLAWYQPQSRYASSYTRLFIANDKEVSDKKPKTKKKQGQVYRADRVLANRGWASRSECFELLKQKRVYQKVGSEMIQVLGPSEKLPMGASLWVDGKVEVAKPPPLLRVYHKPKWVLSVMGDKEGRKNLENLDFISNMHPVGRLDYDSSGLLLFSSKGTLTQTLLHPTHEIEKEYVAIVTGTVDEASLRETLAKKVMTSLGAFPAKLVKAQPVPDDRVEPMIKDIIANLPPEYDISRLEEKGYLFFANATELSEVRLIVEEGKHRMVRRILANSGHPVISLKRERLGVIRLDNLEAGGYRDLTPKEEQWAQALLKPKKKKPSPKKTEHQKDSDQNKIK
jgi:23S rRNA pseudouridine2605 synthase